MQGAPVGDILIELLTKKTAIDTRATASHLRENLINLDSYISTVKSTIDTFNHHLKITVEELKARGDRTDNIMTDHLKTCRVATDTKPTRYIKTN